MARSATKEITPDYRVVILESASDRGAELVRRYWAPKVSKAGFLYENKELIAEFPEWPAAKIPEIAAVHGHILYLGATCEKCGGHPVFKSRYNYKRYKSRLNARPDLRTSPCGACRWKEAEEGEAKTERWLSLTRQKMADKRIEGCSFDSASNRGLMALAGILSVGVTQHSYGVGLKCVEERIGLPREDLSKLVQINALTLDPENVRLTSYFYREDGEVGMFPHVRYVLNSWPGKNETVSMEFIRAHLSEIDLDLQDMWLKCAAIDAYLFMLNETLALKIYPNAETQVALLELINRFVRVLSLADIRNAIMIAIKEALGDINEPTPCIVSMQTLEREGTKAGWGHFVKARKLPQKLKEVLYGHWSGMTPVYECVPHGKYTRKPMIALFGEVFGLNDDSMPPSSFDEPRIETDLGLVP